MTVLLLGLGAVLLAPFRAFWPFLLTGVGFGGGAIFLLFVIGPLLDRIPGLSRITFVLQFTDAVRIFRRSRRRAFWAFLLSFGQGDWWGFQDG